MIKIITLIFLLFTINSVSADNNIRESRLEACTQAYNEQKDHVDSKWIHNKQSKILRCSTYMGLIYAYES